MANVLGGKRKVLLWNFFKIYLIGSNVFNIENLKNVLNHSTLIVHVWCSLMHLYLAGSLAFPLSTSTTFCYGHTIYINAVNNMDRWEYKLYSRNRHN